MHVIRLRSAWREQGGCWVRRFNKPTGLEGGDRVWLAWDGAVERAEFNGEPLDPDVCRHDVTGRLGNANVLSLACRDSELLVSVRLELGPAATV